MDISNRVQKFVPCRTRDVNRSELYIVEGDSALGEGDFAFPLGVFVLLFEPAVDGGDKGGAGVTFRFKNQVGGKFETTDFQYDNGIIDYVAELAGEDVLTAPGRPECRGR